MLPYIAEFLGTMILIILGDGVVANVNLNKSPLPGVLRLCCRHVYLELHPEHPLTRR